MRNSRVKTRSYATLHNRNGNDIRSEDLISYKIHKEQGAGHFFQQAKSSVLSSKVN